ncbi:MAG: glycosyltransferase family 2 protein [Nitrospirae bacterium]|nr:glycosyltransferase family 2 protein [Nitrospirota bacterium]
MWHGKTVSVILPTYNEKGSIRQSIEDFFGSGVVDEIVVVNNNAAAGTSEEVGMTAAREVFEQKQGYGYAIRRGFQEASGEIIIISEPDGTFSGHDVRKLLAYSEDFDAVLGTRTTSVLIWKGSNMGLFLRWGNWAVAKMMEFLFNTTTLTDVGCTMRLIKKKALDKIVAKFTVGSSHFGVEMMLLIILNGINVIEIPVNYKPRVGKSSVTGSKLKAFSLGMTMIWTIVKYRWLSIFY